MNNNLRLRDINFTIENWGATDIFGLRFVRLEEEDLVIVRGEIVVANCLWYSIITSKVLEMDRENVAITVMYKKKPRIFKLGNPNDDYARLMGMTKERFAEVVTKKLRPF